MAEQTIGAVSSRRTAPVRSITIWAAICAALVIAAHEALAHTSFIPTSYPSGLMAVAGFVLAAIYSLRKRALWIPVQFVRIATRAPGWIGASMVSLDRLETWRYAHVAIGIVTILPIWWHIEAGNGASRIEIALEALVAMLAISGLAGVVIQDFMPCAMQLQPERQVRVQDIEHALDTLYLEAEESILGHSEELISTYIFLIRPILLHEQPWQRLLRATLTGNDASEIPCGGLRRRARPLEADLYNRLVDLAARKIRLEHNRFNLRISTGWLGFHVMIAIITGCLIIVHVLGVLYLAGL